MNVTQVPTDYEWEDPRPESPLKWKDLCFQDEESENDNDEEYVPLESDDVTDDDGGGAETKEDGTETEEGEIEDKNQDDENEFSGVEVDTSDDEYNIARDKVKGFNKKILELARQLQREALEGKVTQEGGSRAPQCEREDSDEDTPQNSEDETIDGNKRGVLVSQDTDFTKFSWAPGQRFATREDFRNAVAKYAIHQGRNLKFDVSDEKRGQRLGVECVAKCPFKLYGSWDSRRASFVVKTVVNEHSCNRTMKKNRQLKSTWLAKQFLEIFKARPHWPAKDIIEMVRRAYRVIVLRDFAYKVKYYAHRMLHGSMQEHYLKVGRYLEALKKASPGTHLVLVTDPMSTTNPVFQRLYVCFEGLQKGWKEGCRKIICVDACFLKTFLGGQLMVAVGTDGNDQMYPIAWAIVEGENNLSWEWFLSQLQISLELGQGEEMAIVSDEHQAIIHAVASILPLAEHRHCARHIFALWHKTYRGDDMKLKFWKIAKAYNEADYLDALNELKEMDEGAAIRFQSYNPKLFCRAFMSTSMKSDIITSNLAETFNGWVINARTKHLIHMLEDIRASVMQRLVQKRQEMEKTNSEICPRIKAKLEKEKLEAAHCDVLPSHDHLFQVEHNLDKLTVNLEAKTCTCKKWDMCGFPCCHAIAAIFFCHTEAEEFVEKCYKRDVYLKAYSPSIPPCEGERHWPRIECPLQPPFMKVGPGRPRKNRIKGPHECPKKPGKLTRHGIEMTCSLCQNKGHNKRRCPNRDSSQGPTPSKRPRGGGGNAQGRKDTGRGKVGAQGDAHMTCAAQPTMIGRGGRVIRGGLGSRGGGGSRRGSGGGSGRGRCPTGYGVYISDDGATMINVPGSLQGPRLVNACLINNSQGPFPSQASSSVNQ
ncbi:uncharacterized protein LOC141606508 [Silene latifolia]|uniref:uncharacterized protein LOC141606508 n=1 Tax=Silene latifolia TaxID=37657 RepID=UPI003D78636A